MSATPAPSARTALPPMDMSALLPKRFSTASFLEESTLFVMTSVEPSAALKRCSAFHATFVMKLPSMRVSPASLLMFRPELEEPLTPSITLFVKVKPSMTSPALKLPKWSAA